MKRGNCKFGAKSRNAQTLGADLLIVYDNTTGSDSAVMASDGNTDNTNRFQFTIPLTISISLGEYVTSTATIANTTSEFSPVSIIQVRTVITNRRITYRVNPN